MKGVIVAIPLAVFSSLINNNFQLLPKISFTYHSGQTIHAVGPLSPSFLIHSADASVNWRIFSDSFSWGTHIPYRLKTINTKVQLTNNSQPTIYFRAVGLATVGDDVRLAYAQELNTLQWHRSQVGSWTFWQRPTRQEKTTTTGKTVVRNVPVEQYDSFSSLLESSTDLRRIGIIGINPFQFTRVADYHARQDTMSLPLTLRGDHDLYVYAERETISLTFQAAPINRRTGHKQLSIRVGRFDQLNGPMKTWLTSRTFDLRNGDHDVPTWSTIRVTQPVEDGGLFLVQIRGGDDIIWRNLQTPQHYLNFRQVYLAEGPAYGAWSTYSPLTFSTNGTSLSLWADHEPGYQDVSIGKNTIHLKRMRIKKSAENLTGVTEVTVAKPDVRVWSDGLIALGSARLIPNVTMPVLDPNNLQLENIDYLLADYQVVADPKHLTINQTYNVDDLNVNSRKQLVFTIESPGLVANNYVLGLDSIKATLIRGAFPWAKIREKLSGITS